VYLGCHIVVYFLNSCPHKILKDKTPGEAFTYEKPKVSWFHVSGCHVYIHVLEEKRAKLEQSSIKCVFVSYNETYKAYWIYVPTKQKTILSRDEMFVEDGWSSKS
jgi:hypothetical protein